MESPALTEQMNDVGGRQVARVGEQKKPISISIVPPAKKPRPQVGGSGATGPSHPVVRGCFLSTEGATGGVPSFPSTQGRWVGRRRPTPGAPVAVCVYVCVCVWCVRMLYAIPLQDLTYK